jgi:hypothetical protein
MTEKIVTKILVIGYRFFYSKCQTIWVMTYRAPGLKHGHPAISVGPLLHPRAFARGTITRALDLCLCAWC